MMGWIMVVCWVLHLFPDFSLVHAVTNLTLPEFLEYWTDKVVIRLLSQQSEDRWHPSAGSYRSRMDLLRQTGIPQGEQFNVLQLCPGWPGITSGLTREKKEVEQFFKQVYPVLHSYNPNTFISLGEEARRQVVLQERAAEPVAVETAVVFVEPTLLQGLLKMKLSSGKLQF
jgi:hypothetical protein